MLVTLLKKLPLLWMFWRLVISQICYTNNCYFGASYWLITTEKLSENLRESKNPSVLLLTSANIFCFFSNVYQKSPLVLFEPLFESNTNAGYERSTSNLVLQPYDWWPSLGDCSWPYGQVQAELVVYFTSCTEFCTQQRLGKLYWKIHD